MNCPTCHKEIKDGDVFCRSCGAKLTDIPPGIENLSHPSEPALPSNPTELLQDQVRLTRELNHSLEQLLKLQQRADERLKSLQTNTGEIMEMQAEPADVYVADINMSFWAMVKFMVKWVIASIPAAIILIVLYLVLVSVTGSIIVTLIRALR